VDWNEESPRVVAEKGSDSGPMSIYLASKTLAERSTCPIFVQLKQKKLNRDVTIGAWEFYEKNKSGIKWDLSVINPPYVSIIPPGTSCLAHEVYFIDLWGMHIPRLWIKYSKNFLT